MTFATVSNFVAAPPAWAVMWAIAFASFFACKVLSWTHGVETARSRGRLLLRPRTGLAMAYFFAWPGMNPAAFLQRGTGTLPGIGKLAAAVARIATGVLLIVVAVPRLAADHPAIAGAVGMAGIVLVLHFGVLELMNAMWQCRGVDAVQLMNAPIRSTSLADFWGNRWNTAFHDLARTFVFMPLRRPLGVAGATMATFLASGIVHDLVITVPARGGYGLPTLYFLIQGVGLLFERTRPARRLGLAARGVAARFYTAVVVLAPVPLLFPPPFLARVILPFLEVIR